MLRRYLTFLMIVILLASCAQDDPEPTAPKTTLAPTFTPAPQTLLIWHPFDEPAQTALQKIVTDFIAQNPQITITLEYVDPDALPDQLFEAVIQNGAGPDLIFGPLTWIPRLADQGLLEPIYTDVRRKLTDQLPEALLTATEYADTDYGVPFAAEFTTLYYNTTLVATVPTVFEDFATENGNIVAAPDFFTLAGLYFDMGNLLLDAAGGTLVTTSGVESFLTQVQKLAPSFTFTDDYSAFTNGERPFLLASSNEYPTLKAALGDQLAVAILPRIGGSAWRTLLIPQIVMESVNITASSREAAGQFLMYLLSPDAQRSWFENTGQAPVNVAGMEEVQAAWGSTLSFGVSAPVFELYNTAIRAGLDEAIRAVVVEGQEPSEAAKIDD